MAKTRVTPPKAVRDALLTEFNHRCAVCGKDRPQVHHIDEDPSNNDLMNLIPLCPNCHLIDQHNPTLPIDAAKLLLFRRYKDPVILGAQFDPLFRRLRFLDDVQDDTSARELQDKVSELVKFVQALQMGEFYRGQIAKLLRKPIRVQGSRSYSGLGTSSSTRSYPVRNDDQEYRAQLRAVHEQVYALAVELLRYQPWEPPKQKARES